MNAFKSPIFQGLLLDKVNKGERTYYYQNSTSVYRHQHITLTTKYKIENSSSIISALLYDVD